MPNTPGFALPYPSSGQSANVPYDLQQLAEAVEDTLIPETWVLVPAASGYTSNLYVRRELNGTVLMRGSITKDGGAPLVRATTIATLDAGFRPFEPARVPGVLRSGTGGPQVASGLIETAGTIQIGSDATTLAGHASIHFDGQSFQADDPTP